VTKPTLRVEEGVLDLFPQLMIGRVDATAIELGRWSEEAFAREVDEALSRFRHRFATENDLVAHPHLDTWRRAYSAFGVNPKRQRPSAEALLRRVLKSGSMLRVNPVVDVYLLSELEYLLPVGGYDTSLTTGDVVLRRSPGGEPFVAIGGSSDEDTKAGEVVYADDRGVLTRCWNWRDADRAKITELTKEAALFVELPYGDDRSGLEAQLAFIAQWLHRHLGASTEVSIAIGK
jgi:DNA/RNA-binding domain of Phe-tRNA-synthetase-like protein